MRYLKKLLPYVIASLIVISYWKLTTLTDSYAWAPKHKERLSLDIALTTIFFYKTAFWLIIVNLSVYVIRQIVVKNIKRSVIIAAVLVCWLWLAGTYVSKICALSYYTVFQNQSTVEFALKKPITDAGYYIGPLLTQNIADSSMKYRRYVIGGIGEIKYDGATTVLQKILIDAVEPDYIRGDAFIALQKINTEESRQVISNFKSTYNDSLSKRVIDLVDHWNQ